jgi:hypothetical protein
VLAPADEIKRLLLTEGVGLNMLHKWWIPDLTAVELSEDRIVMRRRWEVACAELLVKIREERLLSREGALAELR